MTTKTRKSAALALAAVVIASTTGLTGCTSNNGRMGETIGQTMGGVIGGVAGSMFGGGKGRILTTALGGVLGYYGGKELGRRLDDTDWTMVQQAQNDAYDAPDGQTVSWNNPDSGNKGTVTPTDTKTNPQTGNECREFETTVTVDGQLERSTGTACRQKDGTWQIVENG